MLCMAALSLGGCASGLNSVEGQVVWKDGGPAGELAGSHVVFDLPEKMTGARGLVKPDGSFRLTTSKPEDGALEGDYKVAVIEVRKAAGGPDSGAIAPGLLDPRFYDASTSGLKATVKPGLNKITLTVERLAAAKR